MDIISIRTDTCQGISMTINLLGIVFLILVAFILQMIGKWFYRTWGFKTIQIDIGNTSVTVNCV